MNYPGDCPVCGAPRAFQTDKRKAAGGSWRCVKGGHSRPGGGPGGARVKKRSRAGARPSRQAKPAEAKSAPVGTQLWLTDPSVKCCKAESCFWDAVTCPVHKR